MYETINETIEVLVRFGTKTVAPTIFRWRNKVYKVKKVNLAHSGKVGEEEWYYFSVSDDANYFKLAFNSTTLKWYLDELYIDG
ncbi:hypothetical protein KKB10_06090 [Patescibacteria group bacterium]|nr:hypothetical protein [Patescibacteria group bacterium]MBU1075192.1 hypothetical protein [Patescibacteria group bacterium]MBU1951986.1 hypothetical protein [Patescibacteria group bacterium]